MKRKRTRTIEYLEDYLLNSLEFDPHFPGLQIHSFCHSFYEPRRQTWSSGPSPYLLVSMILDGEDTCTTPDGDREVQKTDYFSVTDLNYRNASEVTHKREKTLERYFVLFHTNRTLHDLLLNFFPGGLPNFIPPCPAKLKSCFEDVRRVLRRSGKTDGNLLGAMGYRLLAEAANQEQTVHQEGDAMTLACRYIENHFCDPALTRGEIASAVGINQNALGNLFRTAAGSTVNQYVLSLRLKKAKSMLENTRLPVAEIAKACGFHYAYYFSRVFREHTGVLPREYRS